MQEMLKECNVKGVWVNSNQKVFVEKSNVKGALVRSHVKGV